MGRSSPSLPPFFLPFYHTETDLDPARSAVVTHKGSGPDSGHYIGWVKKDASSSPPSFSSSSGPGSSSVGPAQDEEWYKFDDDKVSLVNRDKIASLDGGGEDSAAYILVYR